LKNRWKMQSNEILINSVRFIILVMFQILILNHINFLGFVNPYIYVLFILLYPINGNQSLLIFVSFLLGICIDIFGDSVGIHAAASVFIAFIRPYILKFSFGVSYEYNMIKINKAPPVAKMVYVITMVFLHHFVLFALEIFSLSHIILILKSTLLSGIFSVLLILCTLLLFSRKS
jgi:hypothetical protein